MRKKSDWLLRADVLAKWIGLRAVKPRQSERRGFELRQGCSSVPHLCVSLRRKLTFSSMCNSHMVAVQNIFRILKQAQITWSFIGSVGSKFPKSYNTPSYKENPPEKTHTQTNKIVSMKEGEVVRLELTPFQCKGRHHTDKPNVLTTTLQWINTKNF